MDSVTTLPFRPRFLSRRRVWRSQFSAHPGRRLAFVMQRLGHLRHIPDDSFASQAVETSSMEIRSSNINPVSNTLRMRCEGLFRPWPILLPVSLLPGQYHFELARFDEQTGVSMGQHGKSQTW